MEINNPAVLAEITRQFNRYQQAIIDNDIAVLNELFCDNTLTIRYDAATSNIEFMRGNRNGRQSQAWIRMPEGWRIVAAHVSYRDD